jgi:integrase
MASFRLRKNRWQARIRRQGFPDETKSFSTRTQAEMWARSVETQIDTGLFVDVGSARKTTFGDLISRYMSEVTPTMKGASEDLIRLKALLRHPVVHLSMANLTPARIATYRDERLKQVSAGTVIRELAYFSAIINHARREWGINSANPVNMVKKPASPPSRGRVLSGDEIEILLKALEPAGNRNPWTKVAVELALETGMRRGELLSLLWENVDLTGRTAFLPDTKNGDSRTVPLSMKAIDVLRGLERDQSGYVIPVKYFSLDAAFKRALRKIGLDDVRFHDLRRTAITRMAEKLPNVIELAAVSGHKSLMVLKRYYRPNAKDLAAKLD